MFFRLRHPAVVYRDDQQREIDRADTGEHVAHEIFVTRNIDNSDVEFLAVRAGEIQFGETQVDSNSARFLFRKAVEIGSGQRLNQRALAVIDVTCGGDDEMASGHAFFLTTKDTKRTKGYKTKRWIPFCNFVTLKLIIKPTGIFDSRMYVRICA